MSEKRTEAERPAAGIRRPRLSRFGLRPGSLWRIPPFLDPAVDGAVVLVALACVFVGARPLATSAADARPALGEALESVTLPSASRLAEPDVVSVSASDRREGAAEPIGPAARNLEVTLGQYREVAALNAGRKLPCDQLRKSYLQVDAAWIRYSLARRHAYSGALPENLSAWDAALYEGVREADRGFTASGCRRP